MPIDADAHEPGTLFPAFSEHGIPMPHRDPSEMSGSGVSAMAPLASGRPLLPSSRLVGLRRVLEAGEEASGEEEGGEEPGAADAFAGPLADLGTGDLPYVSEGGPPPLPFNRNPNPGV